MGSLILSVDENTGINEFVVDPRVTAIASLHRATSGAGTSGC